MAMIHDYAALAGQTREIYNRQGIRFDRERSRMLFEQSWLARFCSLLPAGGRILDAGCGGGEPIAAYLIQQGYALTGIDFSATMIELAKRRFPDQEWLEADMRNLTFDRLFDGMIGWHSFFHLTPEEQRATLERMAAHLKPGGALMLTVGPDKGEVIGHVGGEPVYHGSLSPEEYRSLLRDSGVDTLAFVAEDPSCDYATILLAQKRSERE